LDLRARERIRQYKLVLPVWERLNKELKLFESSRSLEGASKAADLAKTVLEESKKETSKKSPGVTKKEKTSKESSSKEPTTAKPVRKIEPEDEYSSDGSEVDEDDMPEEISNADAARFDFNKLGKLVQKVDEKTNVDEEKPKEESDEEEEEFKEYSSEEESEESEEEEEHVVEALKEDQPFEIEFTLPKSFQNKKSDDVKPEVTDVDVRAEDFDADSESSDDEGAGNSDESDSDAEGDETETAATNGFFMTADHKPVKVAKTSKKDVKKFAKDNRDGQRERKRHAKAVYGQNLIEMEKQEQLKKKLADKKERKAEKRKMKEEKKNQPAELHGSWASAKRQKEQTVIQKFEGKKITFDDSD